MKGLRVQYRAAGDQIRKEEPLDRAALQARVRKLLVADDELEDPRPPRSRLNVFAVVKRSAVKVNKADNDEGRFVKGPKAKGVNILDPSYRPPKVDSESDEDLDMRFVPGDPPVSAGNYTSPPPFSIASVPSLTPATRRPPPARKATANKKRGKGVMQDPSYRPPKADSGESDEDSDVGFVPGDLPGDLPVSVPVSVPVPVPAVNQTLPPTVARTSMPSLTTATATRPPPPRPTPSKPTADKQRPKAPQAMQDLSFRPPKSDSESDEDLNMRFVPGDLPIFGQHQGQEQVQFSPDTSVTVTSVSISPPRAQPARPPRPLWPPPPPQPIPSRLKRKRIDDPTYRPSEDSEESSFEEDGDGEESESDEGIKRLKGLVVDDVKAKRVKRRKKGKKNNAKKAPEQPLEEDGNDGLAKENGAGKRNAKKKGVSIWDPSYKPPKDDEDNSEEDNKLDEAIKAVKGLINDNTVTKAKKANATVTEKHAKTLQDGEKNERLPKGGGDERRKQNTKKKGKSVFDRSYRPSGDKKDDSDEYSDEWSSSDGGTRRRRKRARVPKGDPGPNGKEDGTEVNDGDKVPEEPEAQDGVKVEEEIPLCQAPPSRCLPPKFGRRKIKQRDRHKPPRVYDPSYKPGNTPSDDDSNSFDSSGSSDEGKKERRRRRAQPRRRRFLPMTDMKEEVIRRMLGRPRHGFGAAPAMTARSPADPAMTLAGNLKRKRPRVERRQTSDQSFRPSETTSDEYSDDWDSSEESSEFGEVGVKGKKQRKTKKKGRGKTKKAKANGEETVQVLAATTGKEDLQNGNPTQAHEAPQGNVKPRAVNQSVTVPVTNTKTKRRRDPLDLDSTYRPSSDSYSSESESGSGFTSNLDHPVPTATPQVSNDIEKSELLLQQEGEVAASPVSLGVEAPQVQIVSQDPDNVKTAFYPLCHGRYTPWPPAPGTVYCQPCFREQVVIRGLLIRRGISETLRLLKVLLGGGSDFGKELNVALEEILDDVETEQMRRTRVEDYGQDQEEKVKRQERVRRGKDTQADAKPMHSTRSSLRELPEDVQTFLVLRRLTDLVNSARTSTESTERPSISNTPHTKTPSINFPSTTDAVLPKSCSQQQELTGPSRYSSPLPSHLALVSKGEAQNRTGTSIGMNMSYFSSKHHLSAGSHLPCPSPGPLDNAMNVLHDALGVSTWQARRLWNRYGGSRIWDLAKVDSLVQKSHARFQNGRQVKMEFPGAEGKNWDIKAGMGNNDTDQDVMHALEGLADLEKKFPIAFAANASQEEKERAERQKEQGRDIGMLSLGEKEGKKRSRDEDDYSFLGWDHIGPPSKKCKLTTPIDLFKPQSQEAVPSQPWIPEDNMNPRMIPCHSCSRFHTVNYNSYASSRGNNCKAMGSRPWVKTLQWGLDIGESEAAKLTLNNLLDFISRSGKTAHVKKSGWEFVVHHPGGTNEAETRIVFLDVRPGLDMQL